MAILGESGSWLKELLSEFVLPVLGFLWRITVGREKLSPAGE